MSETKSKLLIFIVAYNAETTIGSVLRRIPVTLRSDYDVEVLIIDDASQDSTFDKGRDARTDPFLPFPITVLHNPVNQGYGGNQKIGYHYAVKNSFAYVALIHGDGQYAPECLPELLQPLKEGKAAAVFGSRMMLKGGARRGGMPLYKYIGNKILTFVENKLLGTSLSEFHSGYRIYSVEALKRIPFHLNTHDFHFDTEIIIQLVTARQPIVELPIPTYYGDEICYVNGFKYAWDVALAAMKARLQRLSLFYDRKFDCAPDADTPYVPKFGYASSHTFALEAVQPRQRVIDLGCAGGYLGHQLKKDKDCTVIGVDSHPPSPGIALDGFFQHDLDSGLPDIDYESADVIVLLDVIEHLRSPERFVASLADAMSPKTTLVVTSPNIAFLVTRAMLSLGQFNYGKRGILDLTHTRLFTFGSLRALFEQVGFQLIRAKGIPAPYPLAVGNNWIAKILLMINQLLIRISKGLFAYQIYYEFHCSPSLGYLLHSAERSAEARVKRIEAKQAA